jgi:carboxypeptidase Q
MRWFSLVAVVVLAACSGGSAEPVAPTGPAQPVVPLDQATAPETAGAGAEAEAPAAAATPIADQYREVAARIMEAALADEDGWAKLEYLTDQIGPRLSGSKALERAIDWAVETMKAEGHENVRTEKVMVPHWVRGHEEAEIVAPYRHKLNILGLGGTVATPKKGLTAEVVVVRSWEHLAELGEAGVKGKIVLYNVPMRGWSREHGDGYGDTVGYRVAGPSQAAKLGAAAVLMRSLTARSLDTPHTGTLRYEDGVKRIPAAAVTVEAAELIDRLIADGDTVKVRLVLSGKYLPDAESANVIAELRGTEKPDEIVVIGGHIDSWDIGQGAHDDATGCVMMMQALTLLRRLDLRPRRTIRVVLWTNEENGTRGADAYRTAYADQMPNHVMALESDSGGFAPRGFQVDGDATVLAHTRDIASLLVPIGATEVAEGFSGVDIHEMAEEYGVPALGLWVFEDEYFDYHHTAADTLDKVVPEDFAKDIAAVAIMAYVVADMPGRFGQAAEGE